MIVLARLEAQHADMQGLLEALDKAEEQIRPVLAEGTDIADEHYERVAAGEAHPSYFKGRRVFKFPSISEPRTPSAIAHRQTASQVLTRSTQNG